MAGICLVRPENTQCQARLEPKEATQAAEGRVLPIAWFGNRFAQTGHQGPKQSWCLMPSLPQGLLCLNFALTCCLMLGRCFSPRVWG